MKKLFLSIMLGLTALAVQAQVAGPSGKKGGQPCAIGNLQVYHAGLHLTKGMCPGNTGNLLLMLPPAGAIPPAGYMMPPPGWNYVWYTNPTHTGIPVPDPSHVGAGKYYLFVHNPATGCFNTSLSTIHMTIACCNASPSDKVALVSTTAEIPCHSSTIPNLNAYAVTNNLPIGVKVIWSKHFDLGFYESSSSFESELISPINVPAGTYYANFQDTINQCPYPRYGLGTKITVKNAQCGPGQKLPAPETSQWINNVEFDENSKFTLFPNPVTDELSFKDSESLKNIAKTTLYNTQGVEVYQSGAKPSQKINVKHLPTGTYVLRIVEKNNAVSNHRILITR